VARCGPSMRAVSVARLLASAKTRLFSAVPFVGHFDMRNLLDAVILVAQAKRCLERCKLAGNGRLTRFRFVGAPRLTVRLDLVGCDGVDWKVAAEMFSRRSIASSNLAVLRRPTQK